MSMTSSLVHDDGDKNEILGSGITKVCSKESSPKFTLSHEGKVATFEFQAHPLFDLFAQIVCNLAVLVALQVQVSEVGARTLKVSAEVEDERKKEEEKGKTEEKQGEREEHALSQQNKEEEEEKEEDIFSLGTVLVFSKKPSRSLWKEPVTRLSSRYLHGWAWRTS